MNIMQYINQVRDFMKPLFDFLLLSKSFTYTVKMSPQTCKERLLSFERPKTGFFYPESRTVKFTNEFNYSRFEICIEWYGRGIVYNAVKATGVIAQGENAETTVVKGTIRFGIIFLAVIGFPLSFLFIFNLGNLSRDFGFYILWLALSSFYITSYLRDYHKLQSLIYDTFSEANTLRDN